MGKMLGNGTAAERQRNQLRNPKNVRLPESTFFVIGGVLLAHFVSDLPFPV
jgi:hypothetical protein